MFGDLAKIYNQFSLLTMSSYGNFLSIWFYEKERKERKRNYRIFRSIAIFNQFMGNSLMPLPH